MEKRQIMEANIKFPEASSKLHSLVELQQMAVQGVILMDYIKGDLTMMEAAEALKLNREEMKSLLRQYSMPTIMSLPEELREVSKKNMKELADSLGIQLK